MQYVKYAKLINIEKRIANFGDKNVFLDKKVKTQPQQNKKSNLETHDGARNWTRDLMHPKRILYHCTTESTETIDCSQAI